MNAAWIPRFKRTPACAWFKQRKSLVGEFGFQLISSHLAYFGFSFQSFTDQFIDVLDLPCGAGNPLEGIIGAEGKTKLEERFTPHPLLLLSNFGVHV